MRSTLSLLTAVAGAYAQTSAYTDADTGINFQGYKDATGFRFGLVVPEDPISDFIGQMVSVVGTSRSSCEVNILT